MLLLLLISVSAAEEAKLAWSYKTDGDVESVAIKDGYIVAGSDDYKVYTFIVIPKLAASSMISLAEKSINNAKLSGLSPSKAESILNQAKYEFSNGNYNKAIELANQSYSLAIDVDQDNIPNDKDFVPSINNYYIYAAAGVSLISIASITKNNI